MTCLIHETNLENWTIGQPQKNSHGAYYWSINTTNSKLHPRIQACDITDPMRIPFGPVSFDPAGRKSLDFSVHDVKVQNFLRDVDTWIVDYVWKNASTFFKKPPATREALLENYTPIMSQKNDFDPLLKGKVNDSCLLFIVDDGISRKGNLLDIQPGSSGIPIIQFDKIWVMNGCKFGVTVVTQALLLHARKEKELNEIFRGAFIDLAGNYAS